MIVIQIKMQIKALRQIIEYQNVKMSRFKQKNTVYKILYTVFFVINNTICI